MKNQYCIILQLLQMFATTLLLCLEFWVNLNFIKDKEYEKSILYYITVITNVC
jgi:hypothetical protein